jgi:hypothetical protein
MRWLEERTRPNCVNCCHQRESACRQLDAVDGRHPHSRCCPHPWCRMNRPMIDPQSSLANWRWHSQRNECRIWILEKFGFNI